ncbi:adenosine deaminase [Plectosphaerella plurivora]|uniref:Adenine deaminase n=1 Tax=Plectosphaerella plurivora TaxID=936078 RepID=A0A9P9A9Q0_9PEZI|nr:adenosine deaminase [Plectosphaerella plurivora]
MCKSKLHGFLCALPKCELHVHVEGTMTPDLLFKLASNNQTPLPSTDEDPAFASPASLRDRYARFTSLDDFLRYYFLGFSVLQTSDDFTQLAFDYLGRAHAQGVRHVEMFFDPQAHTSRGVTYGTVVDGLNAARARAGSAYPDMSVAFIPCLLRHLGSEAARDMVDEALAAGHFSDGTLAGLGMAGTEKDLPPAMFRDVYDAARKGGVQRFTAHAGEECSYDYVAAAVKELGCDRIDHGRSAKDSDEVMRDLATRGTLLAICPISNFLLGSVASVAHMPVRKFLDAGVRFSINSDDPGYFDAHIQENFCAVQEAFDLDIADWERIALDTVDGSWCSAQRKAELRAMVLETIGMERGRV